MERCQFLECKNPVGPDDFCDECEEYICSEHALCSPPVGHEPDDHWNVCFVCGEHVDNCMCEE